MAMNAPQVIELNGFSYACAPMPARLGVRVASRLANALAPGIKALPEEGFELNPAQIAALLGPVFSDPSLGDTLEYLLTTFADKTMVTDLGSGNTLPLSRIFDAHFSDKYDDMLLWLVFAIRTSLSSFFRGVRGLGAQVVAGASVSKSPGSAPKTGNAGA